MAQPIKKAPIIAFFGQEAGTKLYNLLNDCCDNPCCPSQKYTLTYTLSDDCNESGQRTLVLTLSSSVALTGLVAISQYLGTVDSLEFNSTVVTDGVPAGVVSVTNLTIQGNRTVYYAYLDSRGNYSNIIEVVSPACA